MKNLKIAVERGKDGALWDIYTSIRDAMDRGDTVSEAVQREIADRTIAKYQKHIAAAFRRYGFPLQDGEEINSDVLLRLINERANVNVEHLTADGLRLGFDAAISAKVSELLGVQVDTVQNFDLVKQALISSAVESVQSGRASKLMTRAAIKRVQAVKAWKVGNVPKVDRADYLNRWYQKKYRRSHVGVWRSL